MTEKKAILSNYLWIRKADFPKKTPSDFARDWSFTVDLKLTSEGRARKQLTSWLRDQAALMGEDPDEAVASLPTVGHLTVNNWTETPDWWCLYSGDEKKTSALAKRLGLTVTDKRVSSPWPEELNALKLMTPPLDHQVVPIKEWCDRHGLLNAAPSFGKTFCAISKVFHHREWALILVPTDILAGQFISRVRDGSGGDALTNCQEVEEAVGYPVIGRLTRKGQLFPITVATWQTLAGKAGAKLRKKVAKLFGVVLGDEAHTFAAPSPMSVANAMHAHIKGGMSATFNRKDTLETGLYATLGPVTTKGKMVELPVVGYMVKTGEQFMPAPGAPKMREWTDTIDAIASRQSRNAFLAEWMNFDVQQGRRLLIISERVKWCYDMQERMEKEYGIPSRVVQGSLSKKRAVAVRKDAEDSMMGGDVQIIFATSVFKFGVDIPVLDTMYMPFPMANKLNLDQMLGRIRRKLLGKTAKRFTKKMPVFRYFVDDGHPLLWGCARSTAKQLESIDACEVRFIRDVSSPEVALERFRLQEQQGKKNPDEVKKRFARRKNSFKAIANDSVKYLFDDLKKEAQGRRDFKRRMDDT